MKLLSLWRRVTRRLTPQEVATSELADAEMALYDARNRAEWAEHEVQYFEKRIARLEAFLAEGKKQ
jgi:hypothetical protein